MPPAPGSDDRVAAVTERLAGLLAAGLPAGTALAHLADTESAETVHLLRRAVSAPGQAVPGPIASLWHALGAAWRIGVTTGAPLASCLSTVAEVARFEQQLSRDHAVLLAGPRATTRLMLMLPVVGIGLGFLIGVNPVAALIGMPGGWLLVVAGVGLIMLSGRWSRRMTEQAMIRLVCPGMSLELLAIALSGGGPVPAAMELVLLEWPDPPTDEERSCREIVALAAGAGVPAGALLRAEAQRFRRDAAAAQQQAAARLGVRLMLPLGICILPAFLLLAVVPVVIGIVSSTATALR